MGSRLKEKRTDLGLTQKQLAERARVSWRTVQVWESSGTATAKAGALKRVADVLGCNMEELVDGELEG